MMRTKANERRIKGMELGSNYKSVIIGMIDKINREETLRRIYNLVLHIYLKEADG